MQLVFVSGRLHQQNLIFAAEKLQNATLWVAMGLYLVLHRTIARVLMYIMKP